MKVAAYQSLITSCAGLSAISVLQEQVNRCESLQVGVLCCAEGVLGGLADYVDAPLRIALRVHDGRLHALLAPLASNTVTTILGFTERGDDGRLYNAAAVYSRGTVVGVYRKRHPAINHSVYSAGQDFPVFTVGALTFGIMICRDSLFADVARNLVARGAQALFVPTNNGMPAEKGGAELVADARRIDIACAHEHNVPVIRADVAGSFAALRSCGATGIIDRHGNVLADAPLMQEWLVVAEVELVS